MQCVHTSYCCFMVNYTRDRRSTFYILHIFRDIVFSWLRHWHPYTSNITCGPVYTHTDAHTQSQLHRDYGEATAKQPQPAHTHVHTSTHKMSVGHGRWQWRCHNLSLIIYTARLTVSMQRPEKIQLLILFAHSSNNLPGEERRERNKRSEYHNRKGLSMYIF